MTLEGEYYVPKPYGAWVLCVVAILMTLEGEYYLLTPKDAF